MSYGYIYLITNILNNKKYVGQKKGKFDHNYWGSGSYIKRAIRRYGKENFTRNIVCWCETYEDLCIKECYYIEYYNCLSPNGYNLTLNTFISGRRQKHSEITKAKIKSTKNNFSDEKRQSIRNKYKFTINQRTEDDKRIIHDNISKSLKNSVKFQTTIHSKEYAEKQRNISIEVWKNENLHKNASMKSKENWKRPEYREASLKGLCHNDSEKQRKVLLEECLKNL